MIQVKEPSGAQDFVIICKNAPPNIIYSQLLHDEFRNDPELSNKEVSFCGIPDPDNPGRSRIEMTIKGTAAEAKLIVEYVNGVILEGKPVYVSYKKVSKKKVDTKIQPSKEADMPERSKRQFLIQDSAPTGTPSSSEGKTYQEPYYDETGRKARAGSRKPAGYYAEATSPRKELLGGHEFSKFFPSRSLGLR